MLTDVVTTLRILVEIALFSLVGQGVLAVLPGVNTQTNIFYQVLKTLASPAVRVARWISPRFVDDRHIAWVALFILLVLWIGLQILKQITFAVENQ